MAEAEGHWAATVTSGLDSRVHPLGLWGKDPSTIIHYHPSAGAWNVPIYSALSAPKARAC